MKNTRFVAALALGLCASSSFAADPVDEVPQPPQAVEETAAYDWAGFYAGVHAGGAWGTTSDRAFTDAVPRLAVPGSLRIGTSGFLGGVQAGYNWQKDAFVAGVEADLGYLGLDGSGSYGTIRPDDMTRLHTDGGPYTTLRGRVGLSSDRFLFFVTGGLFAADFNSYLTNANGTAATARTGWSAGWAAGAGAEMIVTEKVRLKLDYLHFDAGSDRLKSQSPGGIAAPIDFEHEVRHKGDLVRIGLNYRF